MSFCLDWYTTIHYPSSEEDRAEFYVSGQIPMSCAVPTVFPNVAGRFMHPKKRQPRERPKIAMPS